ncbi:MAG: hydroxymethylglutaryl-CoA lyase [Fimbriimonadaceae bacterium]|nr:hydroxymethylglutaryl-CoA lyase [Fimbriimonadaceae bacterium]
MARIIEVGPRDGLQNEKTPVDTAVKAAFALALADAGLREIELTSFVSPKWVPQLADAAEVSAAVLGREDVAWSALVPNVKGLDRAVAGGHRRIALFTAASDAFTTKNINMTVAESLDAFAEVVRSFRDQVPGGHVRGYVSTAFECPYSGRVEPAAVVRVCERLLEAGVDELSLGDTIGVAVPAEVRRLATAVRSSVPTEQVAWHFHDTRGTAMANVFAAMEQGYDAFDSSAAGLGGCPYAPGAGGNLATDDLVYALERTGVETGVDPVRLAMASLPVLEALGRAPHAKAQQAVLAGACR